MALPQRGDGAGAAQVSAAALGRQRARGRTILLDAEQGFGDAIQFRYATPLAREAHTSSPGAAPFHRLLRTVPGVASLVDQKDLRPLSMCMTADEPAASLRHDLETAPATALSLGRAGAGRRLSARLEKAAGRGSGSPGSIRIIAAIAGARCRSPRCYAGAADARQLRQPVQRPRPEQSPGSGWRAARRLDCEMDAGETRWSIAAVMASSICDLGRTAIGHLSGALARPTALLLAFVSDFRWLIDRSDSPWYPTARLYRQAARGDWSPVVADVGASLGSLDGR
jgi:hypothetical protein